MLLSLASLVSPASASAPTVTKTYRTYNSYVYAVSVTDPAASVSASPTQGVPTVSGGCVNQDRRKPNGQRVYTGTACPTPGTVKFTSPDFPACETPFAISVNGTVVYTDTLNSPCPPPAPPAVTVVDNGTTVVFTNPAAVQQSTVQTVIIASLVTTLTADGPFSYTTRTNFSGVGPNTYVYYTATISATLAPSQVLTVTRH